MSTITPTVGRQVWYWPAGQTRSALMVVDDAQPCAATVTYVWGDRMVNLDVVGPTGCHVPVASAMLVQPDDLTPLSPGYAQWMPFQVGQARVQKEPA